MIYIYTHTRRYRNNAWTFRNSFLQALFWRIVILRMMSWSTILKEALLLGLSSLLRNLFMARLEKRIFQNSEFECFLCSRYLDDIFRIWIQGSQKLNQVFNCINSLHPTMKFIMDYSTTIRNYFLDKSVNVL